MMGIAFDHGTQSAYTYRGCRCDQCRKANAENQANIRERRLENGMCAYCKEPRDRKSSSMCTKHLLKNRAAVKVNRNKVRYLIIEWRAIAESRNLSDKSDLMVCAGQLESALADQRKRA